MGYCEILQNIYLLSTYKPAADENNLMLSYPQINLSSANYRVV